MPARSNRAQDAQYRANRRRTATRFQGGRTEGEVSMTKGPLFVASAARCMISSPREPALPSRRFSGPGGQHGAGKHLPQISRSTKAAFVFYKAVFASEFASPIMRFGDIPAGSGNRRWRKEERSTCLLRRCSGAAIRDPHRSLRHRTGCSTVPARRELIADSSASRRCIHGNARASAAGRLVAYFARRISAWINRSSMGSAGRPRASYD